MGFIDGLFIADESKVEEAIGKEIYFGEVLGKHSDIYGTLEKEDIEVIDIGEDTVVQIFEAFGGSTLSGYNPLEYYESQKDE